MKIVTKIAKVSLGLAIGAAVTAGSLTLAKPPGGGGGGGGGGGCNCLDVWIPVICSNGVVYSNMCYAGCAKATGCVPYGND